MNFIKIVSLIIALFYWSSLAAQEYQLYHQSNETNSLIFEEQGEIPLSLSTIISGTGLSAYNIQLGYNPLKHLNFSGAYLKDFGSRGSFVKGENNSYTFSLGTNYKISWTGKTVRGKWSDRRMVEKEKEINFNLNVAYAVNSMKFNRFNEDTRNLLRSKTIRYNSISAKLGFSRDLEWGRWGLSGQVNINNYKELSFNGDWETGAHVREVVNYFEGKSTTHTWSLSFHSEIGTKTMKLITGGSIVVFEQFSPYYPNRDSSPLPVMFYIGGSIDMSKLDSAFFRRK